MCKAPKIPKTPQLQDMKAPDMTGNNPDDLRKARKAKYNGTLLTGPSGIERSAMNLGGTTLLGG